MSNSADETYAKLLSEHGSVTGARRRESIQAAYAEFPHHPGIVALEAERYVWRGDLDRAKSIIEAARKLFPDDENLLAVDALIICYEGDLSTAQQIFEAVYLKNPRCMLLHSNFSAILIQNGEAARAEFILEQGHKEYPDNIGLMSAHYYMWHMLQKPERNAEIMGKVEHIESDLVYMMKARTAMWDSKWSESEQFGRQAIALNPESSAGWEHLAMILTNKGELREAKSAANFALELNSRSVPSLRNLAKIATIEGDVAAATQYAQRADIAVPYLKPFTEIRKANQLFSVGKVDQAIKILLPLASTPSGMTQKTAVHSLLTVLPGMENPKEGLRLLQQIESAGFHQSMMCGVKALLLAKNKEFDAANQVLAEGEVAYADSTDFRVYQIQAVGVQKQVHKVELLANELLDKGLGSPHFYIPVSVTLYDSGLKDLAERFYQDLIRKFPSSSSVTMLEMMRELDRGNLQAGISKLRELGMKGDLPPRKVGCFGFLGIMGTYLLYKLGLKKPKRKK